MSSNPWTEENLSRIHAQTPHPELRLEMISPAVDIVARFHPVVIEKSRDSNKRDSSVMLKDIYARAENRR